MYSVSQAFRNKEYSGESEFKGRLVIGNTTVPNEQLSKITIEDYIFDSSSEENNGVFYIGTFIAQKVTIKFKNLDGLNLHSGDNAELYISQYVDNAWVEIPMGKYLVDDLAKNYHETCEIDLLDYSVKFRKNIDYSPCFVDGKATVDTILQYICQQCGVELGTMPSPNINSDVETGQYDSTISGKRWVSYIAELKGCNAKIGRDGKLYLTKLMKVPQVTINALESASWELGEKYKISRVRYDNGLTLFQKGDVTYNTLYLRQDNPFILNQETVDNIYDILLTNHGYTYKEGTIFNWNIATDVNNTEVLNIYGDTSQKTTLGNYYDYTDVYGTPSAGWSSDSDGWLILNYDNTSGTSTKYQNYYSKPLNLQTNKTYTLVVEVQQLENTNLTMSQDRAEEQFVSINRVSSTGTKIQRITTKSDFTDVTMGIRFFANVSAGKVGKAKIRLSVIDADGITTDNFVYEPFSNGATPNPDFPQEIEKVSGDNTINILGKNMFNYIDTFISSNYGLTNTLNEDGSITTTGIPNANYRPIVNQYDIIDMLEDNEQYTISSESANQYIYVQINAEKKDGTTDGIFNSSASVRYTTFTVDKTTHTHYYIKAQTCNTNTWGNASRTITNKYMLEKGNQATDFEPYKKQSYEINLGKNLFDKDSATYQDGKFKNSSGVETNSSTSGYTTSYVEVKPNTTYSISGVFKKTNTTVCVYYYDNSKTWVSRKDWGSNLLPPFTFTTPSNCKYIQFQYTMEVYDATTIQIEEGNPTSYSPYFTPIELCKIGDYRDEILLTTGRNKYEGVENIGIKEVNGTYYATSDEGFRGCIIYTGGWGSGISISRLTKSSNKFAYATSTYIEKIGDDYYFPVQNYTETTYDDALKIENLEGYPPRYIILFLSTQGEEPNDIQIEFNETATEYVPPGTNEWWIKKSIGKWQDTITQINIIEGSSGSASTSSTGTIALQLSSNNILNVSNNDMYSLMFKYKYSSSIISNATATNNLSNNTFCLRQGTNDRIYFKSDTLINKTINEIKEILNGLNLYYVLTTPTFTKITNETLLPQLVALKGFRIYEGANNIGQTNSGLIANIKYRNLGYKTFEMYSLKTRNYGDISLDAWDFISYKLGDIYYRTYNNRKLTFEQSIMSETNVQIPTKQQEETTNIIGGNPTSTERKLKTTVNALDNKITLEAEEINTSLEAQEGRISSLEISANGLSTTVGSLQTYTNDELGKLNLDLNNFKTLTGDELGEINSKFDNYATKSDLVTIEHSVNTITTDTYTKTEINTFLTDGSVKKVQTMSLTADENGLSFDKTNAPTSSNINEKGVTVKDRNDNPILRAVYDDTIKNSIVETYRHQVHEYFIMGEHSRFEDYEDGTGCFYID